MPKKAKQRDITDPVHSFDTGVARALGSAEKATIVKEISGWCKQNERNGINLHDDRTWTFNSARAYAEKFDYLNPKTISRWLKELVDVEILYSGNYNKFKNDRTTWHRPNIVFYHLASTRRISSVKDWIRYWDAMKLAISQIEESKSKEGYSSDFEKWISQFEKWISQNEVTIAQIEATLPSRNTPPNTSSDKSSNVDSRIDAGDNPDLFTQVADGPNGIEKVARKKSAAKTATLNLQADEVIEELNILTGANYAFADRRGSESNRKLIRPLFKMGYSLEDLKDMVTFKVWRWTGTEWAEYLRPATLFGGKAVSYLQETERAKSDPKYLDNLKKWKEERERKNNGSGFVAGDTTRNALETMANF